jgi:hypothetical protein
MKKLILILLLTLIRPLFTQPEYDTVYHVNAVVSASPSLSLFQKERYSTVRNDLAPGFSLFIRGMWHPGRTLSVGILTGYVFLSQDRLTGYDLPDYEVTALARLQAIPMQLVVAMQNKVFEFGVGMGPYLLMSTIVYGERPAYGKRLELGLTFFGFYKFPLNETISIGPEMRILYLSYRGIISFMPSINFHYEILRY